MKLHRSCGLSGERSHRREEVDRGGRGRSTRGAGTPLRRRLRRIGFVCGIGALAFFSGAEGQASEARQPNVIILNADDVGYGDVGAYGATKIKTPNIDRLAREGRLFTDFHSASAVCSPSRYALLTGEYPSRRDFWHPIFLRAPLMIDRSQMTIGRLMQEAGYATAIIGKWHLGFGNESPVDWNADLKPGPSEVGFDYYFGIPVLNSHPPFVYVENHKVVDEL